MPATVENSPDEGRVMNAPGLFKYVSEPFATGVIYPAVIAAWAFIGLEGLQSGHWRGWPLMIFGALFLSSLGFIWWLPERDVRNLDAQLDTPLA